MLGVSTETRDDIGSFVLFRRDYGTDSYISFIIDTPEAVTSAYGSITVPPPRTVGATVYIPFEVTCRCLSVSYDVSTGYPELSDYSVAVRIYDGSAQLSMPQLLKTYHKAVATVTEKTSTQTSTESSSSKGTDTPDISDGVKRVYLCIAPDEDNIDAALSVLEEFGVRAAIFVDSGFVEKYPEKVADIMASGNTLGILTDYAVRYDYELENELDATNDRITYTVKRAARLVMYRYDDDDFRVAAAADKAAMKRAGYTLILPDICFGDDFVGIPARELRAIAESQSTKIELSGVNAAIYLRDVLDCIKEYYSSDITVVLPTEASI